MLPEDCQWLRDTHLRGVRNIPRFQSFILYGNEDAPRMVDLYESEDPVRGDPFVRLIFTKSGRIHTKMKRERR